MTPSSKSPQLERALEKIFGVDRKATIESDTCVGCAGPATKFRDDLSRREYRISGFCQVCQDSVFGV